jgi:hypothetical protein
VKANDECGLRIAELKQEPKYSSSFFLFRNPQSAIRIELNG